MDHYDDQDDIDRCVRTVLAAIKYKRSNLLKKEQDGLDATTIFIENKLQLSRFRPRSVA